jgi:hypothetical protein
MTEFWAESGVHAEGAGEEPDLLTGYRNLRRLRALCGWAATIALGATAIGLLSALA